jgi:hypothetical protein
MVEYLVLELGNMLLLLSDLLLKLLVVLLDVLVLAGEMSERVFKETHTFLHLINFV